MGLCNSYTRGGGTATVHICKPWAWLSTPAYNRLFGSTLGTSARVPSGHRGKVFQQWSFQLHKQLPSHLRVWQIGIMSRPKEHNTATTICLALFLGHWKTWVDFHLTLNTLPTQKTPRDLACHSIEMVVGHSQIKHTLTQSHGHWHLIWKGLWWHGAFPWRFLWPSLT